MTAALPRVTYSNIGVDFSPVHDHMDRLLPEFRARVLGRDWSNRIGGKEDAGGEPDAAHSPIDGETVLGRFVAADAAAVDRAVSAAAKAFPAWSARPWPQRVAALRRFADRLEQDKYELAAALLLEVGKSRIESLGEAEEAVDLVRHYCAEMERHDGFVQPMARAFEREETFNLYRPCGVFGVIAPFNFPLALAVSMCTGALVTGNTAVFKPAPGCGLSGQLMARALDGAELPPGVFNLVCGDDVTGEALVAHPRLAGIAFTGSHAVGMAIYRRFAAGPWARPVIVEMGGKNPAYVTAAADLDVAAQGVARSAYGLQGQKCSACSVVFVERAVREDFLARLERFASGLVIGDPQRREVYMGPVYDAAAATRFERAVALATREGRVLHGGRRLAGADFASGGHYVEPTLVELSAGHPLLREELFLPFLALRDFDDLDAALAEGNAVDYGLTAGIYTRREDELDLFLARAEAGVLYANRASGATTGAWPGIQSFCGWKGSGVSQKGGLGPSYLPQFMREQCRTLMRT